MGFNSAFKGLMQATSDMYPPLNSSTWIEATRLMNYYTIEIVFPKRFCNVRPKANSGA